MLKQKHFFNGAVHLLIGQDENGFDGKTVINVNRITEGPNEDGTFVDIIHIMDNNYEIVRVGSIIMPETMTENINKLIESFSVFYDDFQDYYNMSTFKDLIRTMVIDERWHSENSLLFRMFRNLIDEDKFEDENEYIKIKYYGPRYDDDGDHIYNASYEYHLYKDDLKYIDYEEDLIAEDEEEKFYDIDDEDEEVVEEVVTEEELGEESFIEYSEIYKKGEFDKSKVDLSLFPFGYVIDNIEEEYTKLHMVIPINSEQALQQVKNTVANIELDYKPEATEWNTNPKLLELYEEMKKYNLEEVEDDNSWFHDKKKTIAESEYLKALMKQVLEIIGLEQDYNTKYWKPREENKEENQDNSFGSYFFFIDRRNKWLEYIRVLLRIKRLKV